MNDNRNLAIGVLSITATILLAAVILLTAMPTPQALAIGQTDRGGDYIVVTGQFSNSVEMIYVTDAAANRMNAYSYEWNRNQFVLWDSHDLSREFGKGGGGGGGAGRR